MSRRRAVLIHLDVIRSVTPLTSGYLKAMALTEPELARDWDIELYSAHVSTPASQIIADLARKRPQLVGFSVYTWNVRLVQRLLPALRAVLPASTRYLLGGVEVMNLGQRYVSQDWEDVAVCNGEGELTFRDYLLELGQSRPALEQVPGLAFWRDGSWIATPAQARLRQLDDIPSPYLTGVLQVQGVDAALLETNRGCPYQCEFCYWGGAIGARVNRFDEERLKEEITYICREGARTIYFCDANFGMLPRDLTLAEHLVRSREQYRYPDHVSFSTAKNSEKRVERVAKVLIDGGLMNVHSISLQTMNPQALDVAKRSNIKADSYVALQRRLNEWGVSSNVELMWPLPGETLESFKDGIDALCAMGAQAFQIYPLLWINNIGYRERGDELGVVTMAEDDPAGGGEIVVQTREVSYADYLRGLQFATAIFLLHDCRGLYVTMQLLHHLGLATFREVADAFVEWMEGRSDSDEEGLFGLWQLGKRQPERVLQYIWKGVLADAALHAHREQLDRSLRDFLLSQRPWLARPEDRKQIVAALEFDLLSRPYPFLQTALTLGVEPEQIAISKRRRGIWEVTSPYDFPAFIDALRGVDEGGEPHGTAHLLEALSAGPVELRIDHRRGLAFRKERSSDDIHWHLYRMLRGIRKTEARYTCAETA
ncbi:MAG: radical SAM protein [Pseudomonadota bacterium]